MTVRRKEDYSPNNCGTNIGYYRIMIVNLITKISKESKKEMDDRTMKIPIKEWEEIKRKMNELTQKIDTLYNREKNFVSISELCDWLNISRTTLWRLRSEGKIKTYLIGGKMVANKDEIQTLLNEGKI